MRDVGQLRTCDICGKKIFCKELNYADGYHYEDPDGWTFSFEFGDLCPECYALYQRLIEDLKQAQQN